MNNTALFSFNVLNWFHPTDAETKKKAAYEIVPGVNASNLNPDNERLYLVQCPKTVIDEQLLRFGKVVLTHKSFLAGHNPIPDEDIMAVDTERGEIIVILDSNRKAA